MKRWLAALVLLLLVPSCANNPPTRDESSNVQWQQIGGFDAVARVNVDGIDCVVYDGYNGTGGLSCDWSQG